MSHFIPAHRCEICGKVIPSNKQRCDICEIAYPCEKCTNKVKSVCKCNRWKRWFSLQWEKFYREREK